MNETTALNRTALITGANKGIGFHIARALGQRGHTVLVGARSEERGEAAAAALREEGLDARFLQLDVTDEGSVAAAAKRIESEYGRLDILVNNAGIALADGDWNTSELTVATARKVFETNVIGVVSVTNALLPLIRKADAGRIVNVSSEVGSLAFMTGDHPFASMQGGAYGASKSALNMLTVSWSKELAPTGIKINAMTPGYTATDLNNNQGTRRPEDAARAAVELALIGEDGPNGGFFQEGNDYFDTEVVPW
ncbi:SDR family oxidoreductase [Glycomyces algeriensis]|uniref:Short-chain dehydrogenase n=1 Tax=Glycomyces algeriensis TaxID=256037 RepID=A0A9W6G849_9ACTN|nr:SDR family oxidoreductase [Glycomyces algeriensis]MDA1368000.1 SDR family oxidoreductase [Glycomyces algeriensis]MDR7349539.1 NAD(P)-dependent dehydrogenase (short-subunit alcohol dehydrogenase family) [Glycomyces algeriensis]GLI42246.1 short-chain dehydrogenase [Glycomyces algeriensis]